MSDPIRVLLVDDHEMVRRGLAVFLEAFDDLVLVGEAGSSAEALQLCAEQKPDVVLMDLIMPETDGIEATRLVRRQFPNIQVIALTSYKDDEMVEPVMEAGAIGYLFKSVSIDDLAAAIRAAKEGRPTLSLEATQALIAATRRPAEPVGHDLTRREREVLALMAAGLSNPDIAAQLQVSRSTVKTHVSNILTKLQVTSRVEAVMLAVQNKLIN